MNIEQSVVKYPTINKDEGSTLNYNKVKME